FAEAPEGLADGIESRSLRRGSLLLTGLVLAQLVFGALLRHKGSAFGQRLHVLTAFAVVALVTWLAMRLLGSSAPDRRPVMPVKVLMALLIVQLALGVEAWIIKSSTLPGTMVQAAFFGRDLIRSGHVLVGALILGTSMVLTLEAHRRTVLRLNAP